MKNALDISTTTLATDPGSSPPGAFNWRSAFLGAAVGIAGPAYFGTLFSNIALWIFIGQGHTVREAYAYIFQFSLSLPVLAHLAAGIFFAIACGWVSAAYGRGATMLQGISAGLLAVSFPIIMMLSPTGGEMPLLFRAISLCIPVFGSVAGAFVYARKI